MNKHGIEWNQFWLAFIIIIGMIVGVPLSILYFGVM